MSWLDKLGDWWKSRTADDKQLPRETVTHLIADLLRELPDVNVQGPVYQEGPLGGELEHITAVIADANGNRRFVSINVYGG